MVFTLLLAVAYVASAYGGCVNPSETTKFAILNLGYPILLLASLLMLVVWLVLRQWKLAAITGVSLMVTVGSILTYCPINFSRHEKLPQEQECSFKLLTFNVMNFNDFDGTVHERNRTMQYILDVDADIVCLQEGAQRKRFADIEIVQSILPELLKRYPYHTDGVDDMVLLSKFPFEDGDDCIEDKYSKKEVSYVVHIGGRSIKIFNCHLHSIGLTVDDKEIYEHLTEIYGMEGLETMEVVKRLRSNVFSKLSRAFVKRSVQAQELRRFIDDSNTDVIVCGDFNDTPGSYCYRTVRGKDMYDAYLECAFGPTITYHDNRFYFKIDHILYRGDMRAVDVERGRIDSSDHYPLLATFTLQ